MDNYEAHERHLAFINQMREPKEEILEHLPDEGIRPGTIVADDWTQIPKGNCRRCKKPLTKYSGGYFESHPGEYKVKYCFDNSYCEECAKFCASRKHKGYKVPKVISIGYDAYSREILYLEDGTVIEEGELKENERY